MRLHRLRLVNYRGITASEVKIGPQGLTVVEGPNEAGKTSLSEAVGILFDYLDSSKHRSVEAITPVHRDAGPEIELEAESGPYVFTYFKRFHKKPETTLTVSSPKHENHTGRKAHERALEILQKTIDIDLWKALCIQQGDAIEQADLSKQTSLSAALDVAAGGRQADPRQDSLFDQVHQEYKRYFTESGREKKEFKEAQATQGESEAEVGSFENQIHELEKDVTRAAQLAQEVEGLKRQEEDLKKDVFKFQKSLDEIKGLETAQETARLKLESIQKSEQAARLEQKDRQNLIEAVAQTVKAHAKLAKSSAPSGASLKQAEDALGKAQSASNKAEVQRKDAESILNLRHEDLSYFNNKLHLEQLKERKDRIDRAREEAALADNLLKNNQVDDEVLKTIRKAETLSITAQAKLEAGAPNVLLRGLSELDLQIDGEPTTIRKEENRSLPVSDHVLVTIPGALDVEVTAGSSTEDLSEKVEKAGQKLEAVCKEAGISGPDQAGRAHEERREALRRLEAKNQVEAENFRDLTYEELERKALGLGKSVPTYPAARVQKPELAPNLESAKKEQQNATAVLEKANKAWEETKVALDTTRGVRDELKEQHQKGQVEIEVKAAELKRAEEDLLRSRESSSDETLETNVSKLTQAVQLEEVKVQSAESTLAGKGPDRVKALAETAADSLKTVAKKLTAAQTEDTEVRTRLKVLGEEGLHEQLQRAQSQFLHLQQENAAILRRASAAQLLYTTMKEERDKARRAYVAPLKEKIERLGRLVFSDSFEVEVTEDLSIANRTLDGSTVPFESLSGGTREQLSMISRLACAMTVAKEGGASLILDDALGYTDPERLKLMGAVLAKASRECQIIILTCVPDRYSNVGEATVVRLG